MTDRYLPSHNEILKDEAKRTLFEGLEEFAEYFSIEHFDEEKHDPRFKSTMRVRAMSARKLIHLIRDRVFTVEVIEVKSEEEPFLLIGHAINYEKEKAVPAIGVPICLVSRPRAMRYALACTDFIPRSISHYRQLRSSGTPLISERDWQRIQKTTTTT